ncbi:MAG: hypothetical protein SGARI_000847, partial [Bacillariaceae sp.]
MYCDCPTNAEQSPVKMNESETRRQILEDYEKKGIDLPIVTLEMVRDQSEVGGAATAKPTKKGFLGRRFSKSEAVPPPVDEEDAENAAFPHPPKPEGSAALLSTKNSQYMECDADADDDMPMDEKESNDEDRNADPTIQPVPVAEEDPTSNAAAAAAVRASSPFCCPQPEAEPEALFSTTEQTATMQDESPAGGDFCCAKNNGDEHDPHYVKSNLQLPEGFDDEHDMSFHDIMNKGSLIDADESVMTSNAEDPCDPMLHKERALGKVDVLGSR